VYHRAFEDHSFDQIVRSVARRVMDKGRILAGLAIVENAYDETALIRGVLPHELEEQEKQLLALAQRWMPRLPFDHADVLLIDEIGKEISGMGLDPNVVGRDVTARSPRWDRPRITRIFVRDLSWATEGSAPGIGQADFTTERLVAKIDFQSTAVNSVTACGPEAARIPLAYPCDRDALGAALKTLRPCAVGEVRIAHIKNTLELETLLVSSACAADLRLNPRVRIAAEEKPMAFDEDGNLLSPFEKPSARA
jgi:hypothetical protein